MRKLNRHFVRTFTRDLLFYTALLLYMFSQLIGTTYWATPEYAEPMTLKVLQLMRYVSYAMCVVKLVQQRIYKRRRFLALAVTMIVCAVCATMCSEKLLIFSALFVFAAEGEDSDRILRIVLCCQSAVLAMAVFSCKVGLIPDFVRFSGGRDRFFLGFSWVTTAPILFLFMILEIVYLRRGRMRWTDLLLAPVAVWLYWQTRTRMALLYSLLALAFFFVWSRLPALPALSERWRKWLKYLLVVLPWACALLSLVSALLYNGQGLWNTADKLLSYRLSLAHEGLQNYGITLLGQPIRWIGNSLSETLTGIYNYVDNSYLQILLNNGVVFLVLILSAYSMILWTAVENKNQTLIFIVMLILAFSLTEPRLVNLFYNPFLLLVVSERIRKSQPAPAVCVPAVPAYQKENVANA